MMHAQAAKNADNFKTISFIGDEKEIWLQVGRFSNSLNMADTVTMKQILPKDFNLQWMHENFIGKKPSECDDGYSRPGYLEISY